MTEYRYVAKGSVLDGISIYRVDKNKNYAISTDLHETYTPLIDSSEIDERVLELLDDAYERKWGEKTEIPERPIITKNDDDTGITKEEFLENVLRIFGPSVEYNESEGRLYSIRFAGNGEKKLVPFDLLVLRRLAKKLRYFGSLYEVSKW
ncbi:MAG: hypothetical protein WC929_00035 [Bacilli bacterium]|jgi:hypothetical protein